MKIYIASSFKLVDKVKEVVKALEEDGHVITVRWWERLELKHKFAPLSPFEFYAEPECRYAYNRDRLGIQEADALVFVADDEPRPYNGANVELGMADAWGKPCYSVGRLENSAMYFNVTRCESIGHLLCCLSGEDENG